MNRAALLKDAGFTVGHCYVYEDRGEGRQRYYTERVSGVNPQLTPAQWCSLAMREPPDDIPSSYVGGCCGNMSHVQDLISAAFRDGGWIEAGVLHTIGTFMRDHDDDWFSPVDDDTFAERIRELREAETDPSVDGVLDPWFRIALAFLGTEQQLDLDFRVTPNRRPDPVRRLDAALSYLSWHDLFHRFPDDEPQREGEADEDYAERQLYHRLKTDSHEPARLRAWARVLPPLREVAAQAEALDEPWEGFAVFDSGGALASTHVGLAFFSSRDDAEDLAARWSAMIDEEDYTVAPVRVSAEHGVEKLPS